VIKALATGKHSLVGRQKDLTLITDRALAVFCTHCVDADPGTIFCAGSSAVFDTLSKSGSKGNRNLYGE